MVDQNLITCPKCGHQFAADEAFIHQAEERIRATFEKEAEEKEKSFTEKMKMLEAEKTELDKQKKEQQKILKEQLEKEKAKLKADAEKSIREEVEAEVQTLREENEKRRNENKELKKKEIELLKKEQEFKEREEELQLKYQKQMLEDKEKMADEIRKKEQEKMDLTIREYEKKLKDQEKLLVEMDRKFKQGSMQMQGEVLELALEEFLCNEYPLDKVEEVAKGQRGADVIQTVKNESGEICGCIIYESKRTKTFSEGWIPKLKDDQREQQADLAVLVTEAMPKDMDRFGQRERVWICTYPEVKGLSFVLREMLINLQAATSAQVNKSDKMSLLYEYLTGSEFNQRIEAIVEGFSDMKADIDKEKRAMQKIWKEREKQIEKVISNTVDMYGSIKGIAGKAIGTVKALELPEPQDE